MSFNFFVLVSKTNHPIALYFIGIMKFKGEGCLKDIDESYKILKNLADNGMEKAAEFLDDYF